MAYSTWNIVPVTAAAMFLGALLGAAPPSPPSSWGTARQRAIQREYQVLVQDLYLEESEIQQKQTDYAQKSYDATRDAIQDLVGIIKKTPPSEDPGESPIHYVEFVLKCRELLDTGIATLRGIADSDADTTAKELRIQTLNQHLAEANTTLRALSAIVKTVRNPTIKLKELPELPEQSRDWTELDKAIDQMRNEDLAFVLESLRSKQESVQEETQHVQADLKTQLDKYNSALSATDARDPPLAPSKPYIPAGWVPCQCPDRHPHAGLLVDGNRFHTPLLTCDRYY